MIYLIWAVGLAAAVFATAYVMQKWEDRQEK